MTGLGEQEPTVQAESFLGSVIRFRSSRGAFWNRCEVTPQVITLRRTVGKAALYDRGEVEAIEFEKQRLPPFVWRTLVGFRLSGSARGRYLFVPWRTERLKASLIRNGWPVNDAER